MLIPLTAITITRRALRRTIDPEQLRLLADDITRNGLIQPIAVRALPADRYALVAGRRRLEAHKLLGLPNIDAHLLDGTIADELRGAAENIKRVQLTPLEEADIVRDLHDLDHLSINDIAEQTGHSNSWVQDRLALLSLPQNFQDAIHARHISISGALLLSGITDTDYRDYLLHIAKTNGATVHQVQAWLQEWTARTSMAGGPAYASGIPQPPQAPQPPPQPCFSCEQPTPNDHVILIRFCTSCLEELQHARADLAAKHATTNGQPVNTVHPTE
jgi:ParB family chromosome partitioning protein